MKKLFVFSVFALFLCSTAYSQQYVPFPTENAEWNVKYTSWPYEYPEQAETRLLKYSLHGDTIINEVVYHKLCLNVGTNEHPVYVGVGGLREQNKQVYYIGHFGYSSDASFVNPQKINQIKTCAPAEKNDTELLLYDFNVKVGDVVQCGDYLRTISKIDSIKIDNSFRKCYSFTTGNDLIVEGIGSIVYGLLGPVTHLLACGLNATWEHICFSQNGEALYLNPAYVDCGSVEKLGPVKYFGKENHWLYRDEVVAPNDTHFISEGHTYLKGDTLINGKLYKILENANLGVRENNKKIYSISFNNNESHTETLLYDFDVKVGDTIHYKPLYGDYSKHPVVREINNIAPRNGEQRKDIYIDGDNWIEGIGSTHGFLYSPHPPLTCDCGGIGLLSFERNDSLIYHNTYLCSITYFCKNPIDAIPIVNSNKLNVTVSPNPASDFVKLTFANSDEPCTSVEIMDFQGRKINTISASGANDIHIDLSTYRVGIYFVVVRYAGRSESHKLIKL